MYRPRPCLEYPQASYLPSWGHTLPQPPGVFPPAVDSLRRDHSHLPHLPHLRHPPRHTHIPSDNHGYWNYPSQPISHVRDHNLGSRSFFSSACNLADISVDQTREFDHHNFRIPCPTVPSFPNTSTRPEGNNIAKVPTLATPAVTTRFKRSITAPTLGNKKISAEQLTTPKEGSDKAVMLKYYQDDEPRELKHRKKRMMKSNSFGSFHSYNTVTRRQLEAKLQSDVATVSVKKRQSGSVLPALEQLEHLGQQIANAQARREPIQVCTEQDILTRDESDGTPPLVIDLPDELPPTDSSHPKSKTRVRPPIPPALERSEYIENGLKSSGSIGEKNHSSPGGDIDESPPLVIDIPGTSDSSSCLHRSTLGNVHDSAETTPDTAQEAEQSQAGSSKQAIYKEATNGQPLTGTRQTTEHQQAAQYTQASDRAQAPTYWQTTKHAQAPPYWQTKERAQAPPYWQTTERAQTVQKEQAPELARDMHLLQRSGDPQAVQFQTPEYQQASEQEHLSQRTTSGPYTNYSTQPSHPVLGPTSTGPTADDVPSGKYKCIRCSKSFPSVQTLLRHRIICLAEACVTQRLTCTLCNKTFTSTKASSDHWKEYHSTERQHVCHRCGRRFTLARALEKHSWTHK